MLLHLRGSCCSSSSLGRNRGVDVVFEHRRVAAPVFPVSNNETADSTFRGRCLGLIFCLWHLRLEPLNVQQAPSALSSNNRVCLRLAMTRLLCQSLLKVAVELFLLLLYMMFLRSILTSQCLRLLTS